MNKQSWTYEMKDFLILWSSQALSSLGTSMTGFALIIWVYQQKGTATSVSLLSFFTYLPSILFCFIAGTLADRWDKKRIMLFGDCVAALGTVTVLVLLHTQMLRIWHLYVVNFTISFMNAFQSPAAYVATSLLVPKQHYVRASGLQAFSGSVVSILTPSLATALLAFGGLKTVLWVDLSTFAVAFLVLLLCIRLPRLAPTVEAAGQSFVQACTQGLRFLREHGALFRIILFFAFVNLLAYTTGMGILPALILARTGNDQAALGIVSSALGLGTLVGSVLVTAVKPAKNRVRVIFASCALSFALADPLMALGRMLPLWAIAAFMGNVPLPFLSANLTALMRTNVPLDMQGRVFSARDTVQYSTIPLGLFLGGLLSDHVMEPFMKTPSALQGWLSALVGTGNGSGMALLFLATGIIGCISSVLCLKSSAFDELA